MDVFTATSVVRDPHEDAEIPSLVDGMRSGQQIDLRIKPPRTRNYQIATFGEADTLLALFEDSAGDLKFRGGDDDSGEDRNAQLKLRLQRGRSYVLRVRMYYAAAAGETAVMWW